MIMTNDDDDDDDDHNYDDDDDDHDDDDDDDWGFHDDAPNDDYIGNVAIMVCSPYQSPPLTFLSLTKKKDMDTYLWSHLILPQPHSCFNIVFSGDEIHLFWDSWSKFQT